MSSHSCLTPSSSGALPGLLLASDQGLVQTDDFGGNSRYVLGAMRLLSDDSQGECGKLGGVVGGALVHWCRCCSQLTVECVVLECGEEALLPDGSEQLRVCDSRKGPSSLSVPRLDRP